MSGLKKHYYIIKSKQLKDSETSIVSGNVKLEKVKLIFFYLQYKAFEDITYDIELKPKDFAKLLVDYYGFTEEKMILVKENIYELDLPNIWNELIREIELPIDGDDIKNSEAEYKLIDIYNSYSKNFIFINASFKLPKWAFEQALDPLSFHVTHNGVLIKGINMINPRDKEKIKEYYEKVVFYGEDNIFFDFNDFPPYKYSFSWDGRHISICEVKEYEDLPTEVMREMKIGYYLTSNELKPIDIKLKDFEILRRKMRLI